MHRAIQFPWLPPLAWLVIAATSLQAQPNVWTYHYDNMRLGANTNETILAPVNVNTNTFGKLFSCPVDGYIYAEPLYVASVAITNQGVHNVVFVATEHDSVYAFDADSNAPALWHRNFLATNETTLNSNDVHTTDIVPEIGITGTPVIDVAAGTLYVVAKTKITSGGTSNYFQRLYALDITSGNDQPNSPANIQFSVPGTGDGTDGTYVPFNPRTENQRPGLLLLNGAVYIGWAGHGDKPPYHGIVAGYDATTLQLLRVFNATPNGSDGGFWQAGGPPAADTNGNLYIITGNGTFDTNTGGYGDSFIKLTPNGTNLSVASFFTPFNQLSLSTNDTDLGSSCAVLLPDEVGSASHPHLVTGVGKGKTFYLMDRDNMGGYATGSDTNIVQFLTNAVGVCLDNPAYFNHRLYHRTYNDFPKAFLISNGLFILPPVTVGTNKSGFPGSPPTISANGTNNAIMWAIDAAAYPTQGAAILRAYDANNLATELYNSSLAGARDVPGGSVKFTVPTVINGKVYVGTETALAVYGNGLFTSLPVFTSQPQSQTAPSGSNVTFSIGAASSNAFTIQWLFNGVPISGANASNYVITNAQALNAGTYSVVLSNLAGTNLSSSAFLSVISPLTNYPGAVLAPPNLVNWWPADGNAVDIFSGLTGTPQNGFTYTAGESGLAFHFDGLRSYLLFSASNLPPPWTLCAWIYRQNALSNAAVLIADGNYAIKLEQYNQTRKVGITDLTKTDLTFNYSVPSNTWTHLALVGVSNGITLYANGVSQGTLATNNFPLPRTYMGVQLVNGGRLIDAMLASVDELQLFNRALSAGEVASIYSAGSAGMYRVPQFANTIQSNGQFSTTLSGQTGKTFTIYTSTDLTNWLPLVTLPNPTGTTNYSDTSVTNGGNNFYRASQP